jgi:preprotein translocase subunit SecA
MLRKIITAILGDPNEKEIKSILPLVEEINRWEKRYEEELKSDEDFPKKTEEFRKCVEEGTPLDVLLPEAFGLVKSACRRLCGRKWSVCSNEIEWDMVPFDVQLIGAAVLHKGKIAEMKTGEGKTLVSTLAVYLNALSGKGVWVVTVNEYLAQRDSEWMGGLYKFLGLSVGSIHHGQDYEEKKTAYECDIIYGTNNEFGFDYLRDNMASSKEYMVQRGLNYAIIDEVDSILIDEARTPLIISAPAEESTSKYTKYAQLVRQLEPQIDYLIDEKVKTAFLTDAGIAKIEKLLDVENIYTDAGFTEVHHLEQALKAHAAFKNDVDYVVKDGEIIIVDEFTGRLMAGRRYSDGLHQAIEAKEGVEIKRESRTLATVTLQNFFRLFRKLAGMTGTAATEAEEFLQIYGLETITIPTHRSVARVDMPDAIFKNRKGKFMAAVSKIKDLHEKGQPVLVGTISVEQSELLSKLLQMEGVPHNVLNAKNHAREAEIVKNAGQRGAVTIATNMAGRGTDIKLGSGVTDLGGLFVLGTERHESRRIDNQLRGRSGRQGDPGTSQFFVSMEDDLMRLFGSERVQKMMNVMNIPDDMPIENGLISRAIEGAQKKVEGHHFDIRKHLVQYDDVMNIHREIMYSRRRKVLLSQNIKDDIFLSIAEVAAMIVANNTSGRERKEWDLEKIAAEIDAVTGNEKKLTLDEIAQISDATELTGKIKEHIFTQYDEREKKFPSPEVMRNVERGISLRIIDDLWMSHIENMAGIREAISLRGYAQRDPLIEYKSEGYRAFEKLLADIRFGTVNTLFRIEIADQGARENALQQQKKMITNEDQIESVLGGTTGQPIVVSSHAVKNEPVTGRNDPCPCGSGKKYKKCHGQE